MKHTPSQTQVVHALAKERLLPFVMMVFAHLNPGKPPLIPSWYLRAMCYWLERVAAGEILRSMIWIQPRALKSITVAVAFPCWLLGRNAAEEIMVATYGDKLSLQHSEHRRSVLEAGWYNKLFPLTRISPRGNRQEEIVTTKNGRCLAVTVGGRLTGSGANFIIHDDLQKADETHSEASREKVKNWLSAAVNSRLNPKGVGAIVSIQQRLHEDDAPAFLRDKGYECLCLPAIAPRDMLIEIGPGLTHLYKRNDVLCPELMSREQLEQKRLESDKYTFAAQYLQDPVLPGGNLIRLDHFPRYSNPIPRELFDKVFQSWDTATSSAPTADWSVCLTCGYMFGRLFVIDIFRKRLDYPDLKRAVIAQQRRFGAQRVIMEDANAGTGLIQEFHKSGPFPLIRVRPILNKEVRLIAQTGQIEEGRIWLPAELENLDELLHELKGFPVGKHDDLVDSMSQLLAYMLDHWRYAECELAPDGRPEQVMRGRKRPPLLPLPDWLELN